MLNICLFSILLATLLAGAVCQRSWENYTAVTNGNFKRYPPDLKEPWTVYLYISDGGGHVFHNPKVWSGCSGALFNKHFIITAANCLRPVQGKKMTICLSFGAEDCQHSVLVDEMPIIYYQNDRTIDDENLFLNATSFQKSPRTLHWI